jgi:hypothetical protein
MPLLTSSLDRFLTAVHRRHVVLRVLERTGLCILVACGACALLIPLLLWQGQPPLAPAAWTLGLGCVAGVLWGSLRRPRRLEAAMEADRQLRLADLLGTALTLRESPASADPWAASVLATADARCRELSPSSVILYRLGARAWGGIGLATALVLAVALLAGSPADTRAARSNDAAGGRPAAERSSRPPDRPLIASVPSSVHRSVPQGAGTDTGPDRGGSTVADQEKGPDAAPARPGESPDSRAGAADAAGGTSGSSSTDRRPPAHPPDVRPEAPGTAAVGATRPTGPPAGGAGRSGDPSGDASTATGPPSGTSAGAARGAAPATPPWVAPGFDSGARRAREALDSGDVPAAYRDIVRKYFERP